MSAHVLRRKQLAITSYNYHKLFNTWHLPLRNNLLQSCLRISLLSISHFNRFIIRLRLELVRYNLYHHFLCIDKSPVIPLCQWAFCFLDALYAVDQSQRTAPSDQSQQWEITERRGLERQLSLILDLIIFRYFGWKDKKI